VERPYSSTDIESAVNKLVDAERDRRAAQEDLDRFKEDNAPPNPPGEFPNLRPLIEYDSSRRSYKTGIERRELALRKAEQLYKESAGKLHDVLPEDVPLHHEHSGFAYVIVNRQGEVIITEMTRLKDHHGASESPGPSDTVGNRRRRRRPSAGH
jgi:hypothetical protein